MLHVGSGLSVTIYIFLTERAKQAWAIAVSPAAVSVLRASPADYVWAPGTLAGTFWPT